MEPGAADLVAGRLQARPGEIAQRARAVRLLTCDVDGVLTDGRVYVDDDGRETKAFHALDGVGIKRLAEAGVTVAWITGSPSESVVHRARRLGVEHVFRGSDDKLPAWERLCATLGVAPSACAHASVCAASSNESALTVAFCAAISRVSLPVLVSTIRTAPSWFAIAA